MNLLINELAIRNPKALRTERLLIKPMKEDFKDYVFLVLGDFEVRHGMHMPTLDTKEKQDAWWERFAQWRSSAKAIQWCMFDKQTNDYIGMLTIKEIDLSHSRGELGYSIMKTQWMKGYGKEGAAAVLNYGFEEVNLHTIIAQIATDNIGSQKIVKGLGMLQEGHFVESHLYNEQFFDTLQFSKVNPKHV